MDALVRSCKTILMLGIVLAPLFGCSSTSQDIAGVASSLTRPGDRDSADRHYRASLAAIIAKDGLRRDDRLFSQAARADRLDVTQADRDRTHRALAELASSSPEDLDWDHDPHSPTAQFTAEWRVSRQTLYLGSSPGIASKALFEFSGLQARRVEIRLVSIENRPYRLDLTCDGAMSVRRDGRDVSYPGGVTFGLSEEARTETQTGVLLLPSEHLRQCSGFVAFAGRIRPIELAREERRNPALDALANRYDICRLPDLNRLPPLEKVFYAPSELSETCPFALGRTDLLSGEIESFNVKVKALLGRPLPRRFFDRKDPEAPIDFKAAPRLSLVYLSYLDFKADFSGQVMDRLLRFHAARGTPIRIMASEVLERPKDRALLEQLAADYPNVQLRLFSYRVPKGATMLEAISKLHKVHHVKMLAALAAQPGKSVAIIGGRNIHDGFLFDRPVDLSRYPRLQQYRRNRGLTINYYSNWHDFDLAFHDERVVHELAAHLSTLWFDDANTQVSRPFSISAPGGKALNANVARHFISVPYADGEALEAYYVQLIDAARHSIEIVNPYLHLPPAIAAAIDRALRRHVRITIIGRIDMSGDLGGIILTALNQMFVNQYGRRMEIYDFKAKKTALHSKILMIDRKLVVISSVNLNYRSFLHDSENGVTIVDADFYRRMKPVFEQYRAGSSRAPEAPVNIFWRLATSIRILKEAL